MDTPSTALPASTNLVTRAAGVKVASNSLTRGPSRASPYTKDTYGAAVRVSSHTADGFPRARGRSGSRPSTLAASASVAGRPRARVAPAGGGRGPPAAGGRAD